MVWIPCGEIASRCNNSELLLQHEIVAIDVSVHRHPSLLSAFPKDAPEKQFHARERQPGPF